MSQGKLYTASLNCDDDKKGEPLYGVRLLLSILPLFSVSEINPFFAFCSESVSIMVISI